MSHLEQPVGTARVVVGRLAPSPTGGLHLGHARTFLIAWLAARRAGGRVILRIEDLDRSRVRAEARADGDSKTSAGWDSIGTRGRTSAGRRPLTSSRSDRALYDEILDRLKKSESVYPCTCTRADVERAASAPHLEDEGPTYPGTCSHRRAASARRSGRSPVRLAVSSAAGPVDWNDLVLGKVELDPARAGGDFIVAAQGAGHSYQLAVVADDDAMGVNQVIRGNDLVPSTPRQILLYRRLGWPEPRFGHVSLAVDADGRRLAKRDGSLKLATLRENGVDPRLLIGALVHSCGWTREIMPMVPRDAIGLFNPLVLPQPRGSSRANGWRCCNESRRVLANS